MRGFFAWGIIIIGSFLEIWYYRFRFVNDGISSWLAITIGIALTLLLALAVFQRQYWWAWAIIIPVSLYSVFATSAGQAFSLGEILREDSTKQVQSEYTMDEIDDIRSQIDWIDSEIKRISESIDTTVDSLEDRGMWRTTLADAEKRQRELREERKQLTAELSELHKEARQHESVEKRSRNIYEFYGNMFHWDKEWLQFILQTILSTFIAVMAPLGIIVLQSTGIKKPTVKKPSTDKITSDKIGRWIQISWIGIRSGKSKKILPKQTYESFLKDRGKIFDRQEYETIYNAAVKSGAIAEDGRIIEKNETEAKKLISEYIFGEK